MKFSKIIGIPSPWTHNTIILQKTKTILKLVSGDISLLVSLFRLSEEGKYTIDFPNQRVGAQYPIPISKPEDGCISEILPSSKLNTM